MCAVARMSEYIERVFFNIKTRFWEVVLRVDEEHPGRFITAIAMDRTGVDLVGPPGRHEKSVTLEDYVPAEDMISLYELEQAGPDADLSLLANTAGYLAPAPEISRKRAEPEPLVPIVKLKWRRGTGVAQVRTPDATVSADSGRVYFNVGSLPSVVFDIILRKINYNVSELLRLAQLNRAWNDYIANNEKVWKAALEARYGGEVCQYLDSNMALDPFFVRVLDDNTSDPKHRGQRVMKRFVEMLIRAKRAGTGVKGDPVTPATLIPTVRKQTDRDQVTFTNQKNSKYLAAIWQCGTGIYALLGGRKDEADAGIGKTLVKYSALGHNPLVTPRYDLQFPYDGVLQYLAHDQRGYMALYISRTQDDTRLIYVPNEPLRLQGTGTPDPMIDGVNLFDEDTKITVAMMDPHNRRRFFMTPKFFSVGAGRLRERLPNGMPGKEVRLLYGMRFAGLVGADAVIIASDDIPRASLPRDPADGWVLKDPWNALEEGDTTHAERMTMDEMMTKYTFSDEGFGDSFLVWHTVPSRPGRLTPVKYFRNWHRIVLDQLDLVSAEALPMMISGSVACASCGSQAAWLDESVVQVFCGRSCQRRWHYGTPKK